MGAENPDFLVLAIEAVKTFEWNKTSTWGNAVLAAVVGLTSLMGLSAQVSSMIPDSHPEAKKHLSKAEHVLDKIIRALKWVLNYLGRNTGHSQNKVVGEKGTNEMQAALNNGGGTLDDAVQVVNRNVEQVAKKVSQVKEENKQLKAKLQNVQVAAAPDTGAEQ